MDSGGSSKAVPPKGQAKRNKKKKVCFQYTKGKCIKGDSCEFAHKERRRKRMVEENNSSKSEANHEEPVLAQSAHDAGKKDPDAGYDATKEPIQERKPRGSKKERGQQSKSNGPDGERANTTEAKVEREKLQRRRRMDLYISGLVDPAHSKQEVRGYVEQFGKVASMHYRKRRNGQKYGFCLVGFQNAGDTDKILTVQDHVLNAVPINIAKYSKKE